MLSRQDFENIDNKIKAIVEEPVDEIVLNTEFPPTIDYLTNNNEAYSIMAAILFIDIRKSTDLTENSKAKSMVKIYRAFMRMCVECVRRNGGVTRNFLGDRIMAVFMDSKTEDGKIIKAMDK
ncbi:MAG: adenylate/guanylate cyclase domain-containing protein, partial [Clostridia bacterium]|nr:adenylate/guanylate cyclase domain-containing protein [Clostridia bacterium]